MRVLAMLAVSAAALPLIALAEPAPAQTAVPAQAPAQVQAPTQTAPAPTVTAQANTAPAATTDASSGDNLDKIVCRSSPPPTGTRLGATRECHTQREWNQRQAEGQSVLWNTQRIGHEGAMNAPGGH